VKPAVVSDFDGTITVGEVSHALMGRFAEGDWRHENDLLFQGKLTVVETLRRQFAMIRRPREELDRFVKETTVLREGFAEFARYCLDSGIPLSICSAGMDIYIQAALGHFPWFNRIPVVVGKANFTPDGIRVDFPQGRDGLDFKATLVEEMKAQGYAVVYLGDGVSDEGAALHADFVFARDRLLALCQSKDIRHSAYEDFHQIRRGLEFLLKGDLRDSLDRARR
ncbi:MAG: MtnX-like HAD-IB family phosphatase, partial [Chloroflexota bacterium]|nr:MtnX-like HAD-IB family phosphatase [Chloroflexota bacterium]